MVARRFFVRYGDDRFPIDYDTDDGLEVLSFQIFSITFLPPDEQKLVLEDAEEIIVSDSSDLSTLSENLRLLSLHDDADRVGGSQPEQGTSLGISDEQLARMLQEEEEALCLQEYRARDDGKGFEQKIIPYISQVLKYEDPSRQQEARKTTPVDVIEEKALVSLWKEGIFNPSKEHRDHAFLLQLLSWFKQSFRWVNTLPCDGCGSETSYQGAGEPLPSEARFGGHRVEIHRCIRCSRITRFPRYNDPLKLLETRRGRCGEWANCFTLYCRAFGYDSRLILDFTDHVWTECFSPLFGRWMHLDPCEGIYDNPFLYEEGWNKKLTYLIAISKDGAHDVTKRYTRKWHEVLSRRDTTEAAVSAVLSEFRSECRRDYSKEAISILENRDKKERDELNSLRLYSDSLISLPGRRSGSQEWRTNRAETGMNKSESLSSSSCPLRACVDDHICSIFSSLTKFLVDFQSNGIKISKVLLYLRNLKGLLLDLRSSSFRARKATIGSNFDNLLLSELIPSLDEFLAAVSLKRDDQDTEISISVAGNPTQAAVALIVASDVLDELLENLEIHDQCREEFVSIFSRFNRISSGQVVASGEELPFGISTSAFDGTRRYKWEEPHGAKGCWLIYKAASGKRHELVAYELMSADDCPERDPRDWIVEGSEDGGSSWYTLDVQKSQQFQRRFQRKRYDVASSHKSNAFRFRFTSVRDPDSQSRFQIGSIDLYEKDN